MIGHLIWFEYAKADLLLELVNNRVAFLLVVFKFELFLGAPLFLLGVQD